MEETIIGYHGTSKEKAKKIVADKEYLICGTFKDWLGKGIYFFQNDPHQAYKFSKHRNNLEHKNTSVLYTQICSENNIIDLLIDEDRDFVEKYTKSLKEKIAEMENEIGTWDHKEGFVLDYLYENNPYDLVRAAYNIPKKSTPLPLKYTTIHIQVCVKRKGCIDVNSIREVNCDAYGGI